MLASGVRVRALAALLLLAGLASELRTAAVISQRSGGVWSARILQWADLARTHGSSELEAELA